MKEYQKYLIVLAGFAIVFAIGVILEDFTSVSELTHEIVQAIGAIGALVFVFMSGYKGFISK